MADVSINIKSINVIDETRDPSKLNEKARRFHDPADKRFRGTIMFDRQDYHFVNQLRRTLMAKLPVKVLVKSSLTYNARFSSTLPKQKYIETSGADMGVFDSLLQLPINQKLPLEAKFKLKESHLELPESEKFHCKTILTECLKPVSQYQTLDKGTYPFNRRIVVVTLRPGESIEGVFIVRNAPDNISATRCAFVKPMDGRGIAIGTLLAENPLDLFQEAFKIMEKNLPNYAKSLQKMQREVAKAR